MIKKVLLTGGTGMLGIALTEFLCKNNIRVTTVARPGSSRIVRIPANPLVEIVECDFQDILNLKNRLEPGYDAFFHFAWAGTYGDFRNDMYLQNSNIKATLDAVELAEYLGCEVFLGAGSQAEYGRVEGKMSPDTKTNPENGYGIAKLCAGQMSRILCKKKKIRHIWLRILSTYGPYDGEHTMVMSGIQKMLKGQRPQYTKGEQVWDYLYCGDAARAFYLSAEKGKDGAVYCIGSGQARRLRDYITDIRDIVNPGMEIEFGEIPYYENQVMYLCADISSLTKDTGFVPNISFMDGIRKTLTWCKEIKDEKNQYTNSLL